MDIQLYLSNKLKHKSYSSVPDFLQQMCNRISMGCYRYGDPSKEKKYMERMEMEMKAYRKSGNREQLLNISVYAWLESQAPSNPKFHWDSSADSVTRGRI